MDKTFFLEPSANADRADRLSVGKFNTRMEIFFTAVKNLSPSKEDVKNYISLKSQGYTSKEMEDNYEKLFQINQAA